VSRREEEPVDTTLAPAGYAAPQLGGTTAESEVDEIVWWVVFVGFAYAVALAWATYCRISGGYPDISLTWRGFKVACKSG
jgi:hypothetical protein